MKNKQKYSVYEFTLHRKRIEIAEKEQNYYGPDVVVEFIKTMEFWRKDQEHLYALYFDTANHLRGYSLISIGLINSSQCHAREVFRNAIMEGASKIILTHNHPSGKVVFSQRDIEATKEMIAAGKIIDIPVVDHIVVGEKNGYFVYNSFTENGFKTGN